MEDVQAPVLTRIAVFMTALVLVAGAAWTAGRVSSPPVPVPLLPKPAVLGGPGQDAAPGPGTGSDGGQWRPTVPGHGRVHAG